MIVLTTFDCMVISVRDWPGLSFFDVWLIAVKTSKAVRDYSAAFIAVGAGILAFTSLDFLYTGFSVHFFDARGLATYTIYITYILEGSTL